MTELARFASAFARDLPRWVPVSVRHYIAHTEEGLSIRSLAREAQVHASTILRQVRRMESRRDDPLIDDALRALARRRAASRPQTRGRKSMGGEEARTDSSPVPSDEALSRQGLRVLPRLAESGAVLAVARDMEMGVVVRDVPGGGAPQRTAVVEREIAQALALREWIATEEPTARIVRYRITGAGRTALKDLIAAAENRAAAEAQGMAEAAAGFARGRIACDEDPLVRHMRSSLGESPLTALARRRDCEGKPFLDRPLVSAGERLREDFELAQMDPASVRGWEEIVTGAAQLPDDASDAAARVAAALADLGPGLGDVALRCCCYLEGLEKLERRMGWSARSGKIVLRIALQRLRRHYDETIGPLGPLIG